jgi:capsular polysaccharide biosynthesis protein
MYTSNASIYVDSKATQVIENAETNTANLVELTTAEMLVDTYIEILSSNSFCYSIKEKLNSPYSAGEIKSMITYSRVEETGVVHISVSAPSAKDAYEICQGILLFANEQIEDVMKVGSVRTIDNATMPKNPSYPSDSKNAALGMIAGLLLSFGIIFIINYFDVHIKTVEDIEDKYDLVVLGTIPNMFNSNTSSGGAEYE